VQAPPLCRSMREDWLCRAAGVELATLLGPGSQAGAPRRRILVPRACWAVGSGLARRPQCRPRSRRRRSRRGWRPCARRSCCRGRASRGRLPRRPARLARGRPRAAVRAPPCVPGCRPAQKIARRVWVPRRTHCQQHAGTARHGMLFCCPSYQLQPSSPSHEQVVHLLRARPNGHGLGPNQVIRQYKAV